MSQNYAARKNENESDDSQESPNGECMSVDLCRDLVVSEASSSEGDHVKETLKQLIKNRRLAEGKSVITVSFQDGSSEERNQELTPEELGRQQERKEQNRRAAQRCRQKKKDFMKTLQGELEEQQKRHRELEAAYRVLQAEREILLRRIRNDTVKSHSCDGGFIEGPLCSAKDPESTSQRVPSLQRSVSQDCNAGVRSRLVSSDSSTKGQGPACLVRCMSVDYQENGDKGSASCSDAVVPEVEIDSTAKNDRCRKQKHPKHYYLEKFQREMSEKEKSAVSANQSKKAKLIENTKEEDLNPVVDTLLQLKNNFTCSGSPIQNMCQNNTNHIDSQTVGCATENQKTCTVMEDDEHSADRQLSISTSLGFVSESDSQFDSSQQSCTTETDSSQEYTTSREFYRHQRAFIPVTVFNMNDGDTDSCDEDDENSLVIDDGPIDTNYCSNERVYVK